MWSQCTISVYNTKLDERETATTLLADYQYFTFALIWSC